ncbi:MAG TPA: hypothetical protein VFA38_09075 [Nitrospirales bacterium]|nr:hypothetical protein [Nitrospirales bacterium]
MHFRQDPGCEPLVEEKPKTGSTAQRDVDRGTVTPPKMENLEAATTAFLQRYEAFLQCCAKRGDADDLATLEAEANAILAQSNNAPPLFMAQSRVKAIVVSVAKARDQLRALQAQHDKIDKAKSTLNRLPPDQAEREMRRIREEEAALDRLATPPPGGPSIPPTGPNIGESTFNGISATGNEIGASSTNNTARTGTGIGFSPPTPDQLVGTPPGAARNRENALIPTKPFSTGPTGTDIGSTGAVGPDAGNSSFNDNAKTGPALGNSSFNEQR